VQPPGRRAEQRVVNGTFGFHVFRLSWTLWRQNFPSPVLGASSQAGEFARLAARKITPIELV
jgi:hypothetical protein